MQWPRTTRQDVLAGPGGCDITRAQIDLGVGLAELRGFRRHRGAQNWCHILVWSEAGSILLGDAVGCF